MRTPGSAPSNVRVSKHRSTTDLRNASEGVSAAYGFTPKKITWKIHLKWWLRHLEGFGFRPRPAGLLQYLGFRASLGSVKEASRCGLVGGVLGFGAKGAYQVGTLKGGLCRPYIGPLPLHKPFMSLLCGQPPGNYPPGGALDCLVASRT